MDEEMTRQWFDKYLGFLEKIPIDALPKRCPCCFCRTIAKRAQFDICPVCFWEDDGQDDHNADQTLGGPNGAMSLTAARANYKAFGACSGPMRTKVRRPLPHEIPASGTIDHP